MTAIKLKPCPFCGCKNIVIIDHEDGFGTCDYYAVCNRCSAMGSFDSDLETAVAKWNNRTINHADWLYHSEPDEHLECSQCGYNISSNEDSNYCPMCGAAMNKKLKTR